LNLCFVDSSIFEKAENRSNVENDTMTLKEYFAPKRTQPSKRILLSNTNATHFELKPAILQLLPTFYIKKNERHSC